MKIVVTTGERYADIDALACVIAYIELLIFEGKNVEAVIAGPLNKSVTDKVKSWKPKFSKSYKKVDSFVVMDVSDPDFLSKSIDQNKVFEIFDHHSGYEDYWKNKLGKKAKIEMIGACATFIWEEFVKRVKPLEISRVSANLLYTAIASNTLNFNASITTSRDKKAFNQLKQFIDLPDNWIETYFKDQEVDVFKNPVQEIINDAHDNAKWHNEKLTIGQIELWDSRKFITNYLEEIEKALTSFGNQKWFLTSPSISEGKNYLYTKDEEIKKLLSKIIDAKFKGNLGETKKLWLRKEILKKLQENNY